MKIVAPGLLLALMAGCSASESGLPTGGGGGGGSDASAGGGAGGMGGAGGNGGGGVDAADGSGGAGGADAPLEAQRDTGPDSGSGRMSTPGRSDCGALTCDPATSICCTNYGGPGGGFSQKCQASGTMCSAVAHCDEKSDCDSGQICCATVSSGGSITESCNTADKCGGAAGGGAYIVCKSDVDCAGSRPYCCPMTAYGYTYYACQSSKC